MNRTSLLYWSPLQYITGSPEASSAYLCPAMRGSCHFTPFPLHSGCSGCAGAAMELCSGCSQSAGNAKVCTPQCSAARGLPALCAHILPLTHPPVLPEAQEKGIFTERPHLVFTRNGRNSVGTEPQAPQVYQGDLDECLTSESVF